MTSSDSQTMFALLRRGQRDAAVVGLFRADRDQVLLLRQPADDVHEQIAVALDAEDAVCGEVGVADDDDARLRLRRVVARFGPARPAPSVR